MNKMNANRTEPLLVSYLHSKGAKLKLPISGTFELTARCNFNCPMCYVHMNQNEIHATQRRELTTEEWIKLAKEAKDRGMFFALLTGGEPFLRRDFFEIYSAMKSMGLMISINTNGSLLQGDIRRQLLENPPFRVNLSLYGGCAQTYRNMCGQDVFEQVTESIKALKTAGVDVRLNLSITPYNRQDLEKIFKISQELGVHVKGTGYMYPPARRNGDRSGCENRMSPEEAAASSLEWELLRFGREEFVQRAEKAKNLMKYKTDRCAVEPDSGIECRAGSSGFWITWDGRMLPCGMMPRPEAFPLKIGFDAAWNQILMKTKEIRMPAECAGCEKKSVCGVCAAMCIAETGHFDRVPTYMCRMTDETIRLTNLICPKWGDKNNSREDV